MVFDNISGKKITQAVVRIFSAKYNRMLSVQVTDGAGRYGFLIGDGNEDYYLTVERNNYEKFKSGNLEVQKMKEENFVAEDIGLKKEEK